MNNNCKIYSQNKIKFKYKPIKGNNNKYYGNKYIKQNSNDPFIKLQNTLHKYSKNQIQIKKQFQQLGLPNLNKI